MSKVLIVSGMHRSGTSLTASWLSRCGLHIGDDLLDGHKDNPKGHFEDKSFLRLHKDILQSNNLHNYLVQNYELICVHEQHINRAEKLIRERERYPQWGWKDPRTALFLDFWKERIPHAKVLFVFRHYGVVADSLLRRERMYPVSWKKRFGKLHYFLYWAFNLKSSYWNIPRLRMFLRVWHRYNQDILSFIEQYPEDSLVFHIDNLLNYSGDIIQFLNSEWGFNFELADITSVYEHDHLAKMRDYSPKALIASWLEKQCEATYQRLLERETKSLKKLEIVKPTQADI